MIGLALGVMATMAKIMARDRGKKRANSLFGRPNLKRLRAILRDFSPRYSIPIHTSRDG